MRKVCTSFEKYCIRINVKNNAIIEAILWSYGKEPTYFSNQAYRVVQKDVSIFLLL